MSLNLALKWMAVGLLLAGLALPAVAPEIANVAVLVLAGAALLLHLGAKGWRAVLAQPAVAMPLAAGVVLALAFCFTAKSPLEVAAVFYFTPLFVVAPLTLLLLHLPTAKAGWLAGSAALVAVVGAALVASYDTFVMGALRAGVSVANPIHFADTSLMLGFVAVTGSLIAPRKWRPLYLLGPVLAGYSVYLSGSRGPLLALMVLIAVGMAYWTILSYSRREAWIRAMLVTTIYLALAVLAWKFGWLDRIGRFGGLGSSLQAGNPLDAIGAPALAAEVDSSTQQRLVMYSSAFAAFLDSPLFGHGLVDFVAKTARYAPPGVEFPLYDHLHNDIADFGVAGGVLGLLAYGMLVLSPIVQAFTARKSAMGAGMMLLAVSASVGYLAMGLTNAMFGLLTLTVLYAVILAVITRLGLGTSQTNVG